MANPHKINLDGNDYEFVAAEVISVDYESTNRDRLYSITCKFLSAASAKSPSDLVSARAINSNIKHIPITGEVVMVCKAPTPYHSGAGFGTEYYYTSPVSIQSSPHHNGIPGANKISIDGKTNDDKIQNSKLGLTQKLSDSTIVKDQIDPAFAERSDVYPLQLFAGDIMIEGRWGNSIRFGSTVDTRRRYPQKPVWGIGTGATGNPIMILSNGTNPKNKSYNQFHIESPDDDDSSIWMTSGQSVKFTPAAKYNPSVIDKEVDLFRKNLFSGNQVIVSSDRIILNSKKQELIGFAKEGIGFATDKTLVLNAKDTIELEGSRIALGFNATSPAILGDRMIELLSRFFNLVVEMNNSIIRMTHGTGVGPTTPPINSGEFVSIINGISALERTLPKTASKLVFLNEKPSGPSSTDKNKFTELRDNKLTVKLPTIQRGDTSGAVTFDNVEK